ncbi:MAG TPA: 1-deoxy-D-xylulose-5-phosphate reductoisomerase, partial [Limnochordia bacterium]|nr:1-deoxy-D-xylulose-5-phosphate reductoisomerase [Limnochordia bacterium]
DEIEIVVLAIVGAAAIPIAIRALAAGKRLALANKECLVAAGHLLTRLAAPGQIVPIDSEHSALHQALRGEDKDRLARLLLTASGGPFRDASKATMARATLADALNHPTWRMGGKITIDSATLMNKGLEVIEARWLFDVDFARIEVVIHPQSIVHSMVEMCDGSVLAQMGLPDMRLPIQYALGFPERLPLSGARLNLAEVGTLTFARPDLDRFPCLRLAYEAGELGGSAPAVLNAANEEAVARFMAGEIGFMEIPRLVEAALAAHDPILEPDLEAVLAADAWARSYAAARAARV